MLQIEPRLAWWKAKRPTHRAIVLFLISSFLCTRIPCQIPKARSSGAKKENIWRPFSINSEILKQRSGPRIFPILCQLPYTVPPPSLGRLPIRLQLPGPATGGSGLWDLRGSSLSFSSCFLVLLWRGSRNIGKAWATRSHIQKISL